MCLAADPVQTPAPAQHRQEEVVLDRVDSRPGMAARRAAEAAGIVVAEAALAEGMLEAGMAMAAEIVVEATATAVAAMETAAEERETVVAAKAIPASNAMPPWIGA
jgi:hypothetical protein